MTYLDVIAYYKLIDLGVTPLHAVELIEKSKQPMTMCELARDVLESKYENKR